MVNNLVTASILNTLGLWEGLHCSSMTSCFHKYNAQFVIGCLGSHDPGLWWYVIVHAHWLLSLLQNCSNYMHYPCHSPSDICQPPALASWEFIAHLTWFLWIQNFFAAVSMVRLTYYMYLYLSIKICHYLLRYVIFLNIHT